MRFLTIVAALALAAAAVPSARARQAAAPDAEFKTAYAAFLAAARANDKEKIADLIAFPVESWSVERNHDVQSESVKDRADFLARYAELFTPFMRSHLARAKTQKLSTGDYLVIWRDAGAEFSFTFGRVDGGSYKVHSYDIGPE